LQVATNSNNIKQETQIQDNQKQEGYVLNLALSNLSFYFIKE